MKRRYYIIDVPNENVIHSLDACVGLNITQRYSSDKKKLFVKTNPSLVLEELDKGVTMKNIFPHGLTTEYTKEEIGIILQGAEWKEPTEL